MARRMLRVFAVLLAIVVAGLLVRAWLDEPRPRGTRGPEAEALASRMETAVNVEAFRRLGAISFAFGRDHTYVWDRERELVDVGLGDTHVLVPLRGGRCVVRRHGHEVTRTDEKRKWRERAMRAFVNDVFWLNPIAKLREPGVVLESAEHDGARGLLVRYTSGGFTPGDAYFWTLAPDGTPATWAMWVSVLPIGGIVTTWEGWETLPGGARVATRHANGRFSVTLVHDVRGAATLAELVPGPDPFAPLVAAGSAQPRSAGPVP